MEIDVEYIEHMIAEGYREGQLCFYDGNMDTETYGWWKITSD